MGYKPSTMLGTGVLEIIGMICFYLIPYHIVFIKKNWHLCQQMSSNDPEYKSNNPKIFLDIDATHGSLALKAYQQNLYLKYYY